MTAMGRRLAMFAVFLVVAVTVGIVALWAVAYSAAGSLPLWLVLLLTVVSLGFVREAYYFFRRQCLWAEAYVHALSQGVSRIDARDVASRYVDVRLPWNQSIWRRG